MIISAPKRNITESQDATEQAHQLTRWQQDYMQLGAGRFYGRLDELVLAQVHVFQEFTSQALYQQCQIDKASLWVGIPVKDQLCRINGQQLRGNQIMCRTGSEGFELTTPDSFAIYGLVVEHGALLQAAQIQGIDLALDTCVQQPVLALPEVFLDQLRQLLALWLVREPDPRAARLQQDVIHALLLQVLQQSKTRPAGDSVNSQRQAVVRRVQAYIEAHPDEALTITQACAIAHASRRTLQYSFESVLGVSPLRFLRCQRLNQVRRALLAPAPDQTVVDTAARWGFWHAGQFSQDYKALFGELPSATMAYGRRKHFGS